ncbi:hypothetical protein [Winogradskyella thalassocola]|uniref:Uncharacterized protein n=1 Tax=Winogradskyella thalassocola TaxID=262004 RepID=A0A1G8LMX1_9FLAO|nr:hypothetical protein [Winogradskyella thalassocola]SDI56993.1 hypothetical protein SAMN04489796_11326 [Winogradskyella thalassocola]
MLGLFLGGFDLMRVKRTGMIFNNSNRLLLKYKWILDNDEPEGIEVFKSEFNPFL